MAGKLSVKDLRQAAKKVGATIECDSGGRYEVYQVCTPTGKRWEPGLHMLRVEWMAGIPEHKQLALEDALQRIREFGRPQDCDDPECDYCHPLEEGAE